MYKKIIVKSENGTETVKEHVCTDPFEWIEIQKNQAIPFTGVYEIIDLVGPEASALCHANRLAEYPPMADYLDAIVKGDKVQLEKYIADCLAVKRKYPKPE